jgi:N-formylglutamate amidohydrolase
LFHTPDELTEVIKELGYAVEVNQPFAGVFAPSDYYQKNMSVFALVYSTGKQGVTNR